jgi:hypothetical protein
MRDRYRMRHRALLLIMAALFVSAPLTTAQDCVPSFVVHPNQEVVVHNMRLSAATQASSEAALAAALESVFNNPSVCCGRQSTFADTEVAGNPSLQELSKKLGGRHTLTDGRPLAITAEFYSASTITAADLISLLRNNSHMLTEWNGQVYVLRGVTFDDKVYSDGSHDYFLRKLLLFDPSRDSTSHKTSFTRGEDD